MALCTEYQPHRPAFPASAWIWTKSLRLICHYLTLRNCTHYTLLTIPLIIFAFHVQMVSDLPWFNLMIFRRYEGVKVFWIWIMSRAGDTQFTLSWCWGSRRSPHAATPSWAETTEMLTTILHPGNHSVRVVFSREFNKLQEVVNILLGNELCIQWLLPNCRLMSMFWAHLRQARLSYNVQ